MGKKAERIRKENKKLSGYGGGGEEGGESRVQNPPKAFGELKISKFTTTAVLKYF